MSERMRRRTRKRPEALDEGFPNETTIAAMDAAERGELRSVQIVDALVIELYAKE